MGAKTKNTPIRTILMKESDIKALGFEFDHEYPHDHFITRRYKNGFLEVEFTYIGEKLETVDLTVSEVFCLPINKEQLEVLSPILGESKCPNCNSTNKAYFPKIQMYSCKDCSQDWAA